MNTLELEAIGLQEMSINEQKDQNGGLFLAALIVYNFWVMSKLAQNAY